MMSSRIVVLGAGGHARVVIDALQCAGADVSGIVAPAPAEPVLGVTWLGTDESLLAGAERPRLANGIGSVDASPTRAALFDRFVAAGFTFVNVIHPSATVARSARLGAGVQILAGAVVQPGAILGTNVIVNTRASVDHDCVVGDHAHIAPGATVSGDVTIGTGAHVGAGATVLQGRAIGARAVVGAGAVVDRDVPAGVVVVGVPARARAVR
jgi:UDP-perosamine 4-acetyltransferase